MTRIEWVGADGNALIGSTFGDPSGPPVVLLHGGGQTRHAWGKTGEALAADGFYAIAMDLRGHGESAWSPDGEYGLDKFAADLKTILRHFDAKPAVVGASLGGLAALLTEGEADPSVLSAVILVDIAHRMEPEGVLRIVSFMRDKSDGFASLEEAADLIATYLPHRKRPKDLSGLKKNLRLGDDGRYRWHWDPKFMEGDRRINPTVMAKRLRDATTNLGVPTLLVRGGLSDILSEEAALEFQQLAPNAEYIDVASAAHMIAGDRNDIFSDAVCDFLERVRDNS